MEANWNTGTTRHLPVDPLPPEAVTPQFAAPENATDCHFHIFGARDRYPLDPRRMYDPSEATIERYRKMANTVGIQRMVVVNGSPYGTNNNCTLDAIEELGLDRARGIAVIDGSVTDKELQRLNESGIRGVRINAITGRSPLSSLSALAERIAPLGWHVQIWMDGERLPELAEVIDRLSVPVAIDHMGQFPVAEGENHSYFQALLEILERDCAWVKLIGYRISGGAPYADLEPFVRRILDVAGERCVWGTDWPHPFMGTKSIPNTASLFDLLFKWASSDEIENILVKNPAQLYGFS